MASAAPTNLPLLYNGLEPLQRQLHGDKTFRRLEALPQLSESHAVPLTVDEFVLAQRFFPIIFSSGENPVPLALMSLHEGVNTFFNASGELIDPNIYIPAYIRRYPFLLARLQEESDQLSLCFDPTSGAIGDYKDGAPLFEGDQPSAAITEVLGYCEQFEQAGQRTAGFMQELVEMELLMEGEVAIQPEGTAQPFVYRGFQMIDEEKFRKLSGDKLRKMNQNGMLGLIFAHMYSLVLVREIFSRHITQGNGPKGVTAGAAPASADA